MTDGNVVTRFAPSPTGYLHIGGARTALFNWAYARRSGGQFVLRMEDTDAARSTKEATQRILSDLQWLGLGDWDQGPDPKADDPYDQAGQKGDHGPYFQSQRGELYQKYLQQLKDAGHVYADGQALRFKMPEHDITVHDQVLGDVTIKREQLEDFIIFKSDGGPTFHFANVVDDATMGVTHVLRAQEHLMNTPKHLALFEALGLTPPTYAHMPLIFNADGSKMSKRDKAKTAREAAKKFVQASNVDALAEMVRELGVTREALEQFLDKKSDDMNVVLAVAAALGVTLPEIDVHDFDMSGYLPEVLLNYIALLGWSPKGDVERFDLKYLVENFDFSGIGKSNAKFDRAKLLAFNAETLQAMDSVEFAKALKQYMQEKGAAWAAEKYDVLAHGMISDAVDFFAGKADLFSLFAQAYQPRAKTLNDPFIAGRFFFIGTDEVEYDAKAVKKVLHKNDGAGLAALRDLRDALVAHDDWQPQPLHDLIEKFCADTSRGMGDVAQPLRVALTGTSVSPAIHDTLALLGKDETLARVDRCLAQCALSAAN